MAAFHFKKVKGDEVRAGIEDVSDDPFVSAFQRSRGTVPADIHLTLSGLKAQVVLPKATWDAIGWGPGTKLRVAATPDGVLIYEDRVFPETSVSEVFGRLAYDGPAKSVEDQQKY